MAGHYNNQAMYNNYNKNHKDRQQVDYYSTPPQEVTNILEKLDIDFSNQIILEPCCGGGHMVKGIENYCKEKNIYPDAIIASDLYDHQNIISFPKQIGIDFLDDNYKPTNEVSDEIKNIDYIVMNPPFNMAENFCKKALTIPNKGLIMFSRLQFLEGINRYNNIFVDNPPTEVYVYANRIQCWKNGIEPIGSSAQAYAWYF